MSESSTAERRTMVAELTDDMTVTDLLDTHTEAPALPRRPALHGARIDRGVRDYLVRLLKGR